MQESFTWRSRTAYRKKTDIQDVRMHDLRHSFASFGLASGLSLAEIGKLLGHSQVQTTARYAHLADTVAQEAAELITNVIKPKTYD